MQLLGLHAQQGAVATDRRRRDGGQPGWTHPARLDRRGLLARSDAWVSDYSDTGQVEWATRAGIDVVRGHGRLVVERLVEVVTRDGVRRLRARLAVVLATGSAPYAVGDVTGEAPLTHWGKHRARMLGRRIAALAAGRPTPEEPAAPVPHVVFSCPQVAAVGPTTRQAEEAGHRVRMLEADYAATAGAGLLRDDVAGRVRLVVDDDTEVVLGATFVGHDVAEMLHAATVAIAGGLDLATLRRAVPSYPTASEVWLQLLEP